MYRSCNPPKFASLIANGFVLLNFLPNDIKYAQRQVGLSLLPDNVRKLEKYIMSFGNSYHLFTSMYGYSIS